MLKSRLYYKQFFEHIESIMDVIDKEGTVLKCRYCARILDVNRIDYN